MNVWAVHKATSQRHTCSADGQNGSLWSEISVSGVHISFCVWIHTVYCTQMKYIGMGQQDEWCNILVGCLVFSQGFQNRMQKPKLET
jgi:hypothetical protein